MNKDKVVTFRIEKLVWKEFVLKHGKNAHRELRKFVKKDLESQS